jgi:uncharacterized protein with HEPN domain
MNPHDRVRLEHMVDALEAALRFAHGRTRKDLDNNEMLQFALVQAAQLVGEAASKISPETRNEHAGVPWKIIVGMRHRLVHAYYEINRDTLWATVADDMPELLLQLRSILRRTS